MAEEKVFEEGEELHDISVDLIDIAVDNKCKIIAKLMDSVTKEEEKKNPKLWKIVDKLFEVFSLEYQMQHLMKDVVVSRAYKMMVNEENKLLLKNKEDITNKQPHDIFI